MSLAAIATMVLMLLLLAGFWLLQAGLVAGVAYVEEKVEIVADLRRTRPRRASSTPGVAADGGAARGARPSATSRRTRRWPRFRDRARERGQVDLTGYLDRNPLPASLEVSLVDPRNYGRWWTCSGRQEPERGGGPAAHRAPDR